MRYVVFTSVSRSIAFWASVRVDNARGRNIRGCLSRLKKAKEVKIRAWIRFSTWSDTLWGNVLGPSLDAPMHMSQKTRQTP